jgi:RecA-family ATPase
MARKPDFTRAQIKNQVEKIQDAIEKLRRETIQRGEDQFRSLTAEEIEKKLKRVNSPFLAGQSYTGWTTPGGSISYYLI